MIVELVSNLNQWRFSVNFVNSKQICSIFWDLAACICAKMPFYLPLHVILTLVLLNLGIPCLCKQCRSKSVSFWRSQLIWICTVCHSVCEFISTIWIKQSDWLTIRNGHGILIYSAWWGLMLSMLCNFFSSGHFEIFFFLFYWNKYSMPYMKCKSLGPVVQS